MKYWLHWLRWDLRRFRFLLLCWLLALGLFTLAVGYFNLKILTIDLDAWKALLIAAAGLGAFGAISAAVILSADPSWGARAFWKTRPPNGGAIALGRLAITGVFFVLLPLLCAWLVTLLPPGAAAGNFLLPLLTWRFGLWGLGVAVWMCAWFSKWSYSLLRLALGATPVFAMVLYRDPSPDWGWGRTALLSVTGFSLALCFAGCLWTYCQGWRDRAADRKTMLRSSLVPFLAIVPGLVWYSTDLSWRRPQPSSSGAQFTGKIALGMPPPGQGVYTSSSFLESEQNLRFVMPVTGLPEDCRASGEWLDLTLTLPDGSNVKAMREKSNPSKILLGLDREAFAFPDTSRRAGIRGVAFSDGDFARLACQPVRLDGVCRLFIRKRQIITTPLPPRTGEFQLAPELSIRWESVRMDWSGVPWVEVWLVRAFDTRHSEMWLDNGRHRFECSLEKERYSGSSHFVSQAFDVYRIYPYSVMEAEYRRDVAAGRVERWHLVRHQYIPAGWVDVPVSLPMVLIPYYTENWPFPALLIKDLTLPETGNTAADLLIIRQAMALAERAYDFNEKVKGWTSPAEPLAELLSKTGPSHLPGLLEILTEMLPPQEYWKYSPQGKASSHKYLKRLKQPDHRAFNILADRVMTLLSPAEIPELRNNKRLYEVLVGRLAERNLVPAAEAGPGRYTATELQQEYHSGLNAGWLRGDILGEALRRGLDWAPAELANIAADHSSHDCVVPLCKTLSAISTCPPEREPGVAWLKENAARLRWDAAARRWAIPEDR